MTFLSGHGHGHGHLDRHGNGFCIFVILHLEKKISWLTIDSMKLGSNASPFLEKLTEKKEAVALKF